MPSFLSLNRLIHPEMLRMGGVGWFVAPGTGVPGPRAPLSALQVSSALIGDEEEH